VLDPLSIALKNCDVILHTTASVWCIDGDVVQQKGELRAYMHRSASPCSLTCCMK
jgi:hypothetical protein